MSADPLKLQDLLSPVVTSMGYELVGVEFTGGVLRVYIDREDGITVDDCGAVSHQVSGLLDVEDPIQGQYTLEISSPGLDRPLFRVEDYERFVGALVRVKLQVPLEGQRKFRGRLQGVDGSDVLLLGDEGEIRLPIDRIEQARLVPEY